MIQPVHNIDMPSLVLPKNFLKRKKAIMAWFRRMDEQLTHCVETKQLRVLVAQTYFKHKVELNDELTTDDKNILARESKVWKIPTDS